MFIKRLSSIKVPCSVSYLESFANFPLSEININHVWFCPHPPQSGRRSYALSPATSLHPWRSRTLWWNESLLSTSLSWTNTKLAPERAGSIRVPTRLATLSSLYGTLTTSQCTSIWWIVKGVPQKLISPNLFKQTFHLNLLSIFFTLSFAIINYLI